ncbi:hypothetical protein BXZ70DRAFT_698575 [Cristinia sonorae]|uniref:HAM1-like N-terminal domain-containing protein n=1 Tax=Cristinia sonorae TaxID=1940300 RepID=A0A8K0XJW9_9AGAR|nr:hypothetical protein BXZ70DRAFT_698575 [Cristinia sonorae]
MGLLFSCCRRSRSSEREPLLPKHSHTDSPARPSQRDLNKLAHVAAALRAGKLPSQDQLNGYLRYISQSSFLRDDQASGGGRLSDSGRKVTEALRATVDALLQVGLEKNHDDKIQELLYHLARVDTQDAVHTDIAVDTDQTVDLKGAAEHLPSQQELSSDSKHLAQSFRTLSRLLLTSSTFRLILSDILTSVRSSIADIAAEIGHAAVRVQDTVKTVEDVSRPGPYASYADAAKAHQVNERVNAVGERVGEEARFVGEDTKRRWEDVAEHGPERVREIVIARVQQTVIQAHRNPAYRQALQTILMLVNKYAEAVTASVQSMTAVAEDGSKTVPTFTPLLWTDDADLATAMTALRTLCARFASGYSVDGISSALYNVIWDIVNIPAEASTVDQESLRDVQAFFSGLGKWFQLALQDPAYATCNTGLNQLNELYDRAQVFMQTALQSDPANEPAWVHDLRVLSREMGTFSARLSADRTTQKLLAALDNLTSSSSIYLDAFTSVATHRLASLPRVTSLKAQELKRQARHDILTWLLPRLLRAIHAVPMPRVEYADASLEAVVDTLLLTASMGSSLVPDHVRFQTYNDVELDFSPRRSSSSPSSASSPSSSGRLDASGVGGAVGEQAHGPGVRAYARTKVHVDGMRLSADDIGYYVRYKGPFGLGYEDQGLLSVDLGSQNTASLAGTAHGGVSLDIELEVQTSSSDADAPLFTVRDVHVTLPNLHFTFSKTNHPILNTLILQPLSGPVARTAVGYYLRRQVWEGLDALGRLGGKVSAEVDRLSGEDGEGGVASYWTAMLNVLGSGSSADPAEDEDEQPEAAEPETTEEETTPTMETRTYPTTQGIIRTTRPAPTTNDSDSASTVNGTAESSTLAIGIGPQILLSKPDLDLPPNTATAASVAREALGEVQGVVNGVIGAGEEVVGDVRKGVDDVVEGVVEVGREAREGERTERRRGGGWRSCAFDL